MATSKCIKCDSTSFEIKRAEIEKSDFKMYFIQCASCGGVVSCVEDENNNYLINQLAKKLNVKLD